MTPSELSQLRHIAQVQLDHAQGEMARINERERNLRRAISDLDTQFSQAALTPQEQLHRMQRLGAQQLWADWTRRKRAEMQRDLALVLAEKSEHAITLRKFLGRRDAIDLMYQEARAADARDRAAKSTEEAATRFVLDQMAFNSAGE